MQGVWFVPSLVFGLVQGFSAGSWQMLLFTGLTALTWPANNWLKRSRYFALEGDVRFDGRDVWIGDHRLPRREVLWRQAWHGYVRNGLQEAEKLDEWPAKLAAARENHFRGTRPNEVWLGLDSGDRVDFDLAAAGPHLMIVGATGTGKSELLRLLVTGWVNQLTPVELTLIDFKGGATLSRFASSPRVVALATDLASTGALAIAETLEAQLVARQKLFATIPVSNIEAAWTAGLDIKRQIIVIDELGELLRQHPKLTSALEQIAARGRSLGMHLIVTNQSLSGITRNLLVNLRARVAIGEIDPVDLSQLGFRSRWQGQQKRAGWRAGRLKTGDGFELDFSFPLGF